MASYTHEQIDRWNAKLKNGFKLDFQYLLNHNEKAATKYLDLPNGKLLQIGRASCRERV